MRYRRSRRMPGTRNKTHIFTGGIRENISQLELKGGELLSGINIEEIDGKYHGYSSLPGQEVTDGGTLPSEIEAQFVADPGTNNATLLIEPSPDVCCEDVGQNNWTLTQTDMVADLNTYKFSGASLYFGQATSQINVELDDAFIPLAKTFQLDFQIRVTSLPATDARIWAIQGTWNITLLSTGLIKFSFEKGGVWYNIISDSPITLNSWIHFAFQRRPEDVRMTIDGIIQTDTYTLLSTDEIGTSGIIQNRFNSTSNFLGWLDEIRYTINTIAWTKDYDVPPVPYSDPSWIREQYDDVAREARRDATTAVGWDGAAQQGAGDVFAVTYLQEKLYGVRNRSTIDTRIWESSLTGVWTAVDDRDATGHPELLIGGDYRFARGSFSHFDDWSDPADKLYTGEDFRYEDIKFLTTSNTPPIWIRDGLFAYITNTNLPDNYDSGNPDKLIENAICAASFKDRLFLGYPSGRVLYSAPGNPLDFDVVNGAGDFYMEDPITNFVVSLGDSMTVFCTNSTYIIQTAADAGISSQSEFFYKFYNEQFSNRSGAIAKTANRILGRIIFMDDRGMTAIDATEAFGDFDAGALSKNVQVTLAQKQNLITCHVIHRAKNQYRLFFSDGTGLIWTFNEEQKIKGITAMDAGITVLCTDESEDSNGDVQIFFGSSDGYVYKMDSGTSFNGDAIKTRFSTAFYSYSTPSIRKRFRKITLEGRASRGVIFYGKLEFDYRASTTPKGVTEEASSLGIGGIYGLDAYGSFTYGTTEVQNPILRDDGYGKNMSLVMITENKYTEPFVLNSMIVDYTQAGRIL